MIGIEYLPAPSAKSAVLKGAALFFLIDLILFAGFCYVEVSKEENGRKRYREKMAAVLAVLATAGFTSIPMFCDGIYFSHDLLFHLNRIYGIAEGVSTQLPVRIHPFWGKNYGYATGVCYGDLLLYFPAFLYREGIPLRIASKIYLFGIQLLTAGISIFSFQSISGKKNVGRLCGFLYTASMWRLVDVYTRGALGEYSAMAFLPLVVLGFWFLLKEEPEYKKGFFSFAVGFTGVIQTHVLSVLMLALFGGLLCLLKWRRFFTKKVLQAFLVSAAGVVFLNLGFLIPLVAGGQVRAAFG